MPNPRILLVAEVFFNCESAAVKRHQLDSLVIKVGGEQPWFFHSSMFDRHDGMDLAALGGHLGVA